MTRSDIMKTTIRRPAKTWPWRSFAATVVWLPAWQPAAAQVEVTYLGNEGFLLTAGETRVLVDALYGDGIPGYPAVPRDVRRELEAGRGRFAGVDLVLASHAHADHFDPAAVARHLRANPAALFLSTREAVAAVRDELGEHSAAHDLLAPGPAQDQSYASHF